MSNYVSLTNANLHL